MVISHSQKVLLSCTLKEIVERTHIFVAAQITFDVLCSPGLTGGGPGFDAGDLGIGDVCLDLCRSAGFFQQVPHLNAAILFPNEENSWLGQGPARRSADLLRARRLDDVVFLKLNRVTRLSSAWV